MYSFPSIRNRHHQKWRRLIYIWFHTTSGLFVHHTQHSQAGGQEDTGCRRFTGNTNGGLEGLQNLIWYVQYVLVGGHCTIEALNFQNLPTFVGILGYSFKLFDYPGQVLGGLPGCNWGDYADYDGKVCHPGMWGECNTFRWSLPVVLEPTSWDRLRYPYNYLL